MLHILHAADLHLDAPFAALNREQARQRRQEQRQLLNTLADTAIQRDADLVLLAGDLLDGGQTYRETVRALAEALGRIPAPVLIAPGNHDYYHQDSLYASDIWPENVLIFPDSAIRKVELPGVVVYGSAFTSPERTDSPLAGFSVPKHELRPSVMVVHGDVGGTGHYGSISRAEIAASGLTYLALGHIHTCSGLRREGNTSWAYPGCGEGRGFDETGDKGALWITIDGSQVSADFIPLCRRRYEVLECDLTGKDPRHGVADCLSAGSRADICRLILTGEAEQVDLADLELTAARYRWAVQLRDHTRLPRNLWDRAAEDGLTGLFLRNMQRRLADAATPEERELLEQAARFGLAALENGEDPL